MDISVLTHDELETVSAELLLRGRQLSYKPFDDVIELFDAKNAKENFIRLVSAAQSVTNDCEPDVNVIGGLSYGFILGWLCREMAESSKNANQKGERTMPDKLLEMYEKWIKANENPTTQFQAFQGGVTAGAVAMRERAMKVVKDSALLVAVAPEDVNVAELVNALINAIGSLSDIPQD